MNVENLVCSDFLKKSIKVAIHSRNKKTVLFGRFSWDLDKMTRLQRVEAELARDYEVKQIERFMIRSGRLVLLGAENGSYTDKEFRFLDRRLCAIDSKGRVRKKSQIARALLATQVGGRRVDWHADELSAGAFNYAPFFYKKGVYDDAIMIDLRRAHYSIYSRLTWDLRLLFDAKRELIGFRNGLVKMNFDSGLDKVVLQRIYGAFASRQFTIWDGLESEKRISFDESRGYENVYYSPTLVFALMQTLHHVAAVAVKRGAVYVYTDGYMFPRGRERDFLDYLDSMRLSYRIDKVGSATVMGYNEYKIGNVRVGTRSFITQAQLDESKSRRRSKAFQKVIEEAFGDALDYRNSNIDFSAVNFLTGEDLISRQYDLSKR